MGLCSGEFGAAQEGIGGDVNPNDNLTIKELRAESKRFRKALKEIASYRVAVKNAESPRDLFDLANSMIDEADKALEAT